jgi:hypothetical protein
MANEYRPKARRLMAVARRTWSAVSITRVLIVLLTIGAILTDGSEQIVAVSISLLFIVSELADVYARRTRDYGEDVKRRADFYDSFGWKPSASERAELELIMASSVDVIDAPYFSSQTSPGPERALENLRESSWWTGHLAVSSFRWTLVPVIALASVLFVLLHVTNASVAPLDTRLAISRAVMSALLVALTVGAVRSVYGFSSLAERARQIEAAAEQAMKSGVDEVTALRLWSDYHVYRAQSPLIPESLWRLRRKALKRAWAVRMAP